jgi:hypothetical protein
MAISVIDIERKRNDTRRIIFKINVDISLWTAMLFTVTSISKPVDDTTKIAQFTGSFVTDGTDGRVFFTTNGLVPIGKSFYDAQALDENGEKITFAEGNYVITQDRTKD